MTDLLGGVCISVNKTFVQENFQEHDFEEIIPGRALKFWANGKDGNIIVVAVHSVPDMTDSELRDFLAKVLQAVAHGPNTIAIVVGDVNCHEEDEPRLIVGSSQAEFSKSLYSQRFDEAFGHFAEVVGSYYTYQGGVAENRHILSRIDRFFIDLPTADLLDRHPQAQTTQHS